MAREPRICPYCHLEITGAQTTTTTQSGIHYHKECYETLQIDEWVAVIEKKYITVDAKLARMITQNNVIIESAEKQQGHLNTIKNIIVIFMILTIIGVILQSCSTALSGY
jgi:hypothetical protein